MLAEYFQVVEPGVGTLVSARESGGAETQRRERAILKQRNRSQLRQPPSVSKAVHSTWLEQPQITWADLGSQYGMPPQKVLESLCLCASIGMASDLRRLAAQMQIGAPNSVSPACCRTCLHTRSFPHCRIIKNFLHVKYGNRGVSRRRDGKGREAEAEQIMLDGM